MNKPDFDVIPHTADLKIEVRAPTLEQLFADCAVAMFLAIQPRTNQPDCREQDDVLVCESLPCVREVKIERAERELMLVDFLSEVLYLSEVHHEAYLDAQVSFDERYLHAKLAGAPVVGFEVGHIKAVTFSDLAIEQRAGAWVARVVFDI